MDSWSGGARPRTGKHQPLGRDEFELEVELEFRLLRGLLFLGYGEGKRPKLKMVRGGRKVIKDGARCKIGQGGK